MPSLDKLQKSDNIVESLDDSTLGAIAQQVITGYRIDEDSRADWCSLIEKAMAIAKQLMEQKSFPWPGASNIKFPLITKASIDYASRTMPEIIQNGKIVRATVVGQDTDDQKYLRAQRVCDFLSYKLLTETTDWEEGTDMLLQVLPVLGTCFKKTYYDPLHETCRSELCTPDKIVVNYHAQSLNLARRITHIITLYSNDIVERQRSGIYNENVDVESLRSTGVGDVSDEDFPIELLEQHCSLDLDNDGYKEPYVVTVHKDSGQVLRIVQRFKKIHRNSKKQVVRIDPEQYFVDFHFIRSPDGGFYSMGFGSLLLPINTAINTLINQLIDAGTLSNTQGGFLGSSLRLKGGEFRVKMGEWKVVNSSGADLAQNVVPLPVREPSQTLFSLLTLMIQMGQDLSSSTDVLNGNQPVQNVASQTVAQMVEQGTKVFAAINKRVYRSLKKEYQRLFELYSEYLTQEEYQRVLDNPQADVILDFDQKSLDIFPVADPTVASEAQRVNRAAILQQLRTADPRQADTLLLQALQYDQATIDRVLPAPDPNAPPPPEAAKIRAEIERMQADVARISAEATLQAQQLQLEMAKTQQANKESDARVQESMGRVWKMQQDVLATREKLNLAGAKLATQHQVNQVKMAHQADKDSAELMIKSQDSNTAQEKVQLDAVAKLQEKNKKDTEE